MSLILRPPWTQQPQAAEGPHLSSTVLFAYSPRALFQPWNNTGIVAPTPGGLGISSATDNAVQFRRDLRLQNADTVTVKTLLWISADASPNVVKIFGTRGTAEGSANRRGWEVMLDGGSLIEAVLQVFRSDAGRSQSGIASTGYSTSSMIGRIVSYIFTVSRASGSSTTIDVWFKPSGMAETNASTSVAQIFGDDTPLANYPEVAGKYAGATTSNAYKNLLTIASLGTITEAERLRFYNNPWEIFLPRTRRIWVPSSVGGVTFLSAATATSITSTTATPRVTLTF